MTVVPGLIYWVIIGIRVFLLHHHKDSQIPCSPALYHQTPSGRLRFALGDTYAFQTWTHQSPQFYRGLQRK